MAKAKFRIKIEEPCPVPKDRLSKVDLGYYCAVCSKCVVDYRQYSDQQIAREFKKQSDKERCGIFTHDQLEKVYREKTPKRQSVFSSLLLSGLLLANRNSDAQSAIIVDTVITVPTDTFALEEDTISLAKVDSTNIDSTHLDGRIFSIITINPDSYINSCDKGIMDITGMELQVYGNFIVEREVISPSFLIESVADSTKTTLITLGGFLGFFSSKPPKPDAPKNSHRNNDRPLWLESLRHRFRGKRKK